MSHRKTAEELMAELALDASYVSRKRESEEQRRRDEECLSSAEKILVQDLRKKGVFVDSVWELLDQPAGYEQAIDVLLQHVRLDYPAKIKEGILRALAVPNARPRWKELLDFYEKNSLQLTPELYSLTGMVLAAASDDSVIGDVIRLAMDESKGGDRLPLLLALQRSNVPKARMLLNELRKDPEIGREATRLHRMKRRTAVNQT